MLTYLAELCLLGALTAAILIDALRKKYLLVLLIAVWCLICALLMSLPKSSYHLLIIGLAIIVFFKPSHSKAAKQILTAGLLVALTSLMVHQLLLADLSLSSKLNAPKLFALWALLLIFSRQRLGKALAVFLILLDMALAIQLSARGIFLGSFAALLALFLMRKFSKKLIFSGLLGICLIYTFAFPILELTGQLNVVESSASNFQRSMLNVNALIDVADMPLAMNEDAIFESAKSARFSYDTETLSVHNMFLAFGLFNGWIPAIALLLFTISMVSRARQSRFAPIMVYLYLYVLLGPDTSETRTALFFLLTLSALAAPLPVVHPGNGRARLNGSVDAIALRVAHRQ